MLGFTLCRRWTKKTFPGPPGPPIPPHRPLISPDLWKSALDLYNLYVTVSQNSGPIFRRSRPWVLRNRHMYNIYIYIYIYIRGGRVILSTQSLPLRHMHQKNKSGHWGCVRSTIFSADVRQKCVILLGEVVCAMQIGCTHFRTQCYFYQSRALVKSTCLEAC